MKTADNHDWRIFLPIIIVLLPLSFLGYYLVADDNELAEVYYQSGLSLIKQNKYDEAAEKFTKAVSYRRDFPVALFRLGECYDKLKEGHKSVRNYRLCLKSLQGNTARTKEEDELLAQVYRVLERTDPSGTQFTRIKNDTIAGLLALANECLNKKYQRFAYNTIEAILKIDPGNKPARELSTKIDKSIIDAQKENERKKTALTGSQNLFNGRDISNWETGTAEYWRVTQGQLVALPETSKTASIKWKGKPPEDFSLALKFFIYAKNPKTITAELVITRGVFKLGKSTFSDVLTVPPTRFRPGLNNVRFTRSGGRCTVFTNGKSMGISTGITNIGDEPPAPCIELAVRNGRIQFESIVLGPLERTEGK